MHACAGPDAGARRERPGSLAGPSPSPPIRARARGLQSAVRMRGATGQRERRHASPRASVNRPGQALLQRAVPRLPALEQGRPLALASLQVVPPSPSVHKRLAIRREERDGQDGRRQALGPSTSATDRRRVLRHRRDVNAQGISHHGTRFSGLLRLSGVGGRQRGWRNDSQGRSE